MYLHAPHIAAQRAREKEKRLQHEEEEMTNYNQEDLQGDWEFKIVRAATPIFSNQARFAALVEEEALAGWEMLEKLDNQRVRFKRHKSARRKDEFLPPHIDPYRTQYGSDVNMRMAISALIGLFVLGAGIGVFLLTGGSSGSTGSDGGAPIFMTVAIIIPMVLVFAGIFVAIKSRQ